MESRLCLKCLRGWEGPLYIARGASRGKCVLDCIPALEIASIIVSTLAFHLQYVLVGHHCWMLLHVSRCSCFVQ